MTLPEVIKEGMEVVFDKGVVVVGKKEEKEEEEKEESDVAGDEELLLAVVINIDESSMEISLTEESDTVDSV